MDLAPTRIAAGVRANQIDPVELISDVLDQAEASSSELNAFISIDAEGALAAAMALREDLAHERPVGPLAGVPFSVKDVIAVRGLPLTAGSRALQNFIPQRSASAVARLQDAGAICIGKTNTPEFAHWMHTDNETYGASRSPIVGYSPGGSSGADAAVVAAGVVGFGIGTDFGGSLRWPSHCTGTAAIRPTIGRVPLTGFMPGLAVADQTLPADGSLLRRAAVIGPIARQVDDLDLILRVIAGPDTYDELCVPAPPIRPMIRATDLVGGWSPDDGTLRAEPEIVDALQGAVDEISTSVSVERVQLPALSQACALFDEIRGGEEYVEVREIIAAGGRVDARTMQAIESGEAAAAPYAVAERWARRSTLRHQLLTQMKDFLVLPVSPVLALPFGTTSAQCCGQTLGPWDVMRYVRAVSLFGFPAVSVPIGTSDLGLPIAVQVVARPFREDIALAVAARLERKST